VDVYKQPKTDSMKNSKRGRLDLQRMADGSFQTVRLLDGELECAVTAMQTVYENGVILVDDNFTAIRVRSNL